jgi:RNA recognition motif-containing protein
MGTRLFVGNLSYAVTEQELRDAFVGDGIEVRSVKVALDRETGRPRGFAFVDTETDEAAKLAIEKLTGRLLQGRPIAVQEAQARPAGPRPGGFGSGPRPGGFGGGPPGPGGFGGPPRPGGFGGPPRPGGFGGPPRPPGPGAAAPAGAAGFGPPRFKDDEERREKQREREKKKSSKPKPEDRERGNWRWTGSAEDYDE